MSETGNPVEDAVRLVGDWRDRLRALSVSGRDGASMGTFPDSWVGECAENMRAVHVRDAMILCAVSPFAVSDDMLRSLIKDPHGSSGVRATREILTAGPRGQDPYRYIRRIDWAADALETVSRGDVARPMQVAPAVAAGWLRWYSGDAAGAKPLVDRALDLDPRCSLAGIVQGALRGNVVIHQQDALRRSVEAAERIAADPADPLALSMGSGGVPAVTR